MLLCSEMLVYFMFCMFIMLAYSIFLYFYNTVMVYILCFCSVGMFCVLCSINIGILSVLYFYKVLPVYSMFSGINPRTNIPAIIGKNENQPR
jgi:hypothetical protein